MRMFSYREDAEMKEKVIIEHEENFTANGSNGNRAFPLAGLGLRSLDGRGGCRLPRLLV
jgi:hypothetical protein